MEEIVDVIKQNENGVRELEVSYSKMELWLSCPNKYYYRHVRKLPSKFSINLVFGSAVHKVLELCNQMPEEDYGTVPEMVDRVWNEKLREQNVDYDDSIIEEKEYSKIMILDYLSRLDRPRPIKCEEHFRTPEPILETAIGRYHLHGFVDGVLECDGARAVILDYKTSNRAWAQDRASKSLQPAVYGAIMGVQEIKMLYEIMIKNKRPSFQSIVDIRNQKQIEFARKMVKVFIKSIESESFYPNRENFLCSEKYCDYYQVCHDEW